jgi:hypothetical protein
MANPNIWDYRRHPQRSAREVRLKILKVIQAINTQRSKTNFPLTYNYNARISLTPPNFDIDRTIEAQSQYTHSFTSISITDSTRLTCILHWQYTVPATYPLDGRAADGLMVRAVDGSMKGAADGLMEAADGLMGTADCSMGAANGSMRAADGSMLMGATDGLIKRAFMAQWGWRREPLMAQWGWWREPLMAWWEPLMARLRVPL